METYYNARKHWLESLTEDLFICPPLLSTQTEVWHRVKLILCANRGKLSSKPLKLQEWNKIQVWKSLTSEAGSIFQKAAEQLFPQSFKHAQQETHAEKQTSEQLPQTHRRSDRGEVPADPGAALRSQSMVEVNLSLSLSEKLQTTGHRTGNNKDRWTN